MIYSTTYPSVLGELTLTSDGKNLLGLWIAGQKYFAGIWANQTFTPNPNLPEFKLAKNWLDNYFAGAQPSLQDLPLAPHGSDFQKTVWLELSKIPYGKTTTYGQIAKNVARQMENNSMSAQAVGGAVGRNPLSIIVPCHRVVGTNGSLTGYASGVDKKIKLLQHEGVDMAKLFTPKKSTAP